MGTYDDDDDGDDDGGDHDGHIKDCGEIIPKHEFFGKNFIVFVVEHINLISLLTFCLL